MYIFTGVNWSELYEKFREKSKLGITEEIDGKFCRALGIELMD